MLEGNDRPLTLDDYEDPASNLSLTQSDAVMALASATSELARAVSKISYTPTQWVDWGEPDINAANLNKIEQGILQATTAINGAVDAINAINGNLSSSSLQHSVNSTGIFFKGGEDLDTFTEPGTWNCNSYNVAQSLIHTPPIDTFGSGFRFDVFASSSGSRVQRIMVHDTIPKIFYRSKFSDTWNNWEKVVSNTDLGNATFWFPTFVLGWDSYTNGTHQLTQSIANKPLLICVGKNGSLSGFWARTQANDDRVIMTPEGAITIHFDSLTQVTITGATSTWNVRSIQIF